MRAIIICGGNVGEYIGDYLKDGDFVICADSGFDSAKKYGIKPDIIIGDMDSVKSKIESENTRIYPTRKDFTDSELAVFYAKEHGFDSVLMFGMTGTRMDHTMTNISLLKHFYGLDACIIDSNNEIYAVDSEISIKGKKGDVISILPFDENTGEVTSCGLEYPLCGEALKFGEGRGVSNVMTENECRVSVNNGAVLVIRSRD